MTSRVDLLYEILRYELYFRYRPEFQIFLKAQHPAVSIKEFMHLRDSLEAE